MNNTCGEREEGKGRTGDVSGGARWRGGGSEKTRGVGGGARKGEDQGHKYGEGREGGRKCGDGKQWQEGRGQGAEAVDGDNVNQSINQSTNQGLTSRSVWDSASRLPPNRYMPEGVLANPWGGGWAHRHHAHAHAHAQKQVMGWKQHYRDGNTVRTLAQSGT
jgi:hypothetical protein